jgi:hypothetical protein
VRAEFTSEDSAHPVEGINPVEGLTIRDDGSFTFDVEANNPVANHNLSVTVTGSQGNSAWGNFMANITESTLKVLATGGTPRTFW